MKLAADENAATEYCRPTRALGHSRITLSRYFAMHEMAALLPLLAGLSFFGWRAALTVALVLFSAGGTTLVWRKIGVRGGQLHFAHLLWLATTLSLMLPAHLVGYRSPDGWSGWPIPLLAGALLTIFSWVLGGLGLGRIHPVVVTYLLLAVLYGPSLTPSGVLQRNHMVLGDVTDMPSQPAVTIAQDPWYKRPIAPDHDALNCTAPSESLWEYTTGQVSPDRSWLSLEGLLRDRLPPLEDLILGSVPGPIGAASCVAVILGGLLLLYRRLVEYRIPLTIVLSAFVVLLILPVPAVITDKPDWRWAVGHVPDIGWAAGVTFANYEILGSPLLFTAFFLATAPAVRPLSGWGRTIYSLVIGALAAVFQLYVSVSFGSYLALMAASLLTPALDKWIRPSTLV
jgi:Na+-translocating ferredoxin:NAD+ oxidoreductase RnfD subunit